MTGAVSWEVLSWVVGIVVAAGLGVAGFLLWLWSVVKALREEFGKEVGTLHIEVDKELEVRDADMKALVLRIEAESARAKLIEDAILKEVGDYRAHAAETFASKEGVNAGLKRVEDALQRMGNQVDTSVKNLTDRIDRMLLERGQG
jgi:hypothetical protein